MTKSLPIKPSVKFLKLEAKSILKSHKKGDSSCCDALRNLNQFKDKSDKDILALKTSLQEVQFALSMGYGFKSWRDLIDNVLKINPQISSTKLKRTVEVNPHKTFGNSFARGLTTLLNHAGCNSDYVSIMGDIGQAFILQGSEYNENLTGGYADLGWWPLDRWHIVSRLNHLSKVYGLELIDKDVDFSEIIPDPEKGYKKHFESIVRREIDLDKPLLSFWHGCFVVTGYDTETPPLLGWCLQGKEAGNQRADNYPSAILTYGKKNKPMNRIQADKEAIQYAVDLIRNGCVKKGLWVSGPLAWKGWEDNLLKRGKEMESRWHANIRMQLKVNVMLLLNILKLCQQDIIIL